MLEENKLYYGDNLQVLREYISSESVDLIYLDPPFNSDRNYNVLFKDESGTDSAAQIVAFDDTWHWNRDAETTYNYIVIKDNPKVSKMIVALRDFIGSNQMMAYLVMMTARLVELHRVLKQTGSLYLHCDPTASHYLKIVLDAIFGVENFRNEIVWKRHTAHNDSDRYGRISDRILFYSKSNDKLFNKIRGEYSKKQLERYKYNDENGEYRAENLTAPHYSSTRTIEWRGTHPGTNRQWRYSIEELNKLYEQNRILLRDDGCPRKDGLKVYLKEAEGSVLQDIWNDIEIGPTSGERLGYPTQKPLALLERIIQSSSNEGDVVLDPFAGCGTAIIAAHKLNRKWIGIDITHLAIALLKYRLKDSFEKQEIAYQVIGEPKTTEDAKQLAKDDRYQFQWWALSLVKARPVGGDGKKGKKGKDGGIDGFITFIDSAYEKPKQIIIQVKSGHVKSGDIRDLVGTVEREKAAIGLFITLEEQTKDMEKEAVIAGRYQSIGWNKEYPKIQILTIEQILQGKKIEMPPINLTFAKAQEQEKKSNMHQPELWDDSDE